MEIDHEIKCEPDYFEAAWSGNKTFEIRNNDRGYQKGDIVLMRECEGYQSYTGRNLVVQITYVIGFQQKENWVVWAFKELDRKC